MKRIMVASLLFLCMTGPVYGQSHEIGRLYDRIDRLEAENERLREEVGRLERLKQYRRHRSGYGRSYGYRDNSLYDASRSMQDLNRLKDSFNRLTD